MHSALFICLCAHCLLICDTHENRFEDYEFSDAAAEHFVLLTSAADAQATINQQLNASCNNASHEQLHAVWSLLREEIDVDDSSVYSYAPPFDNPFDPPGTLYVLLCVRVFYVLYTFVCVVSYVCSQNHFFFLVNADGTSTTFSTIENAKELC